MAPVSRKAKPSRAASRLAAVDFPAPAGPSMATMNGRATMATARYQIGGPGPGKIDGVRRLKTLALWGLPHVVVVVVVVVLATIVGGGCARRPVAAAPWIPAAAPDLGEVV